MELETTRKVEQAACLPGKAHPRPSWPGVRVGTREETQGTTWNVEVGLQMKECDFGATPRNHVRPQKFLSVMANILDKSKLFSYFYIQHLIFPCSIQCLFKHTFI